MRVLFVIDSLAPGGTERSLAELLPLLVREGVEPVVVCLDRREGVEDQVRDAGVEVRYLPGRRLPVRVRALRRMIREERPDVVHTALLRASLVGRLAGAGTPAVVVTSLVSTPYDPVRLEDPNVSRLGFRVWKVVDVWTSGHLTDHFHAVSGSVKRWAVEALRIPPEKVTVVERGRDPARLGTPSAERREHARRVLGLNPGDEVLINVGRQEFAKGQRYLLEAMGSLSSRPELVLLLVGGGGHVTPELRRLADRPEVRDRVRLLGPRTDVPELLAASDVFVLPSVYEGMSGALIEAMALGLPIVASDIPTVADVAEDGENAVLVPARSPARLAEAVTALLDDPPRMRAFGVRSREMFGSRFSLERSSREMVELYTRLVAEATEGRRSPHGPPRAPAPPARH
jgi:glycosyltransferase involved in cell wall biosynthesis